MDRLSAYDSRNNAIANVKAFGYFTLLKILPDLFKGQAVFFIQKLSDTI